MIGIFDSGVGGLTVVKEVFRYLPNHQLIYFGDTARLPYGTKGEEFVKRYSKKITSWLIRRKAQIIVVACHTSSAWAASFLKKEFKDTPIFEMIAPGAAEVLRTTKNGKVGIIGTPGTIRSGTYQKKLLSLNPQLKISTLACPLFVPLVEEGMVRGKITEGIVSQYLKPLKEKGIDTLVLACTHYPLLQSTIRMVMGKKVRIINPAESLAKELKLFLEETGKVRDKIINNSAHQFFFSDEPYNFQKISNLCFKACPEITVKDPF